MGQFGVTPTLNDIFKDIKARLARVEKLSPALLGALAVASNLSDVANRVTALLNLGIARGLTSVTFTASTTAGVITISHGLSSTPVAVVATFEGGGFGGLEANTLNYTSTTFQIAALSNAAITGTFPVAWVAVA